MSKNHTLSISLAAIVFSSLLAAFTQKKISTNEVVEMNSRSTNIFIDKDKKTKLHQKLTSPLVLSIHSIGETQSDVTMLEVVVTAKNKAKNIELAWKIPKEMRLLSGEKDTYISKLNTGESMRFIVEVETNAATNMPIHAFAKADFGKRKLSSSAQYFPGIQAELEQSRAKLHARTKEHIEKK